MSDPLSVLAPAATPTLLEPAVPGRLTHLHYQANPVLASCHRAECDTLARQMELTRSAIRMPVAHPKAA
jgi:hypothetical protein